MPPFDKLLSAEYLFASGQGAPSIVYGVIGALYLVVLVLSFLSYRIAQRMGGGRGVGLEFVNTASIIGMALGITGVVVVALRYLSVPIVSARIVIIVVVVISLVLLAYFIYYLRVVYPAKRARLNAEGLLRRQTARTPARPVAPTRVVKHQRKGKKRR